MLKTEEHKFTSEKVLMNMLYLGLEWFVFDLLIRLKKSIVILR